MPVRRRTRDTLSGRAPHEVRSAAWRSPCRASARVPAAVARRVAAGGPAAGELRAPAGEVGRAAAAAEVEVLALEEPVVLLGREDGLERGVGLVAEGAEAIAKVARVADAVAHAAEELLALVVLGDQGRAQVARLAVRQAELLLEPRHAFLDPLGLLLLALGLA